MADIGNALDMVRSGAVVASLDGTTDEVFFEGQPQDVYQELQLRLDVFDESVVMTQYQSGQATQCYEVDPSDVAAALANQSLSTGLLPHNCLFYAQAGGEPHIGIYLPPQTRTLTVVVPEHAEITTPLPGLVFVGHRQRYEIYACKERPGARDHLYQAPFPNVYAGGSICWGGVEAPNCTPNTIHEAADLFFSSRFNADLNDNKSHAHAGNVTEAWREIQGAETYPVDDLVRDPQYVRLEDLWKA